MSSPPQWVTPETPCYSEIESDWTPSKQPTTEKRLSGAFRAPHEKRARKIIATGEVTKDGIPLPSDPTKPTTLLNLEEIYSIAQEGDRSVMRDYTELFITTGINSYETKAEYAWIYLRPNELGELPISEERLNVLFPEWEMVLKMSMEQPVQTTPSQTTRINLLSPTLPEPVVDEEADYMKKDVFYRSVETTETKNLSDADLRKEVWALRSQNWGLKQEVAVLREETQMAALRLQSDPFTSDDPLPGLRVGKRSPETAFGLPSSYDAGFASTSVPDLPPELDTMTIAERLFHIGRVAETEESPMKRREITAQPDEDEARLVLPSIHRLNRAVRDRVLDSLTSLDDLTKLTDHGYGDYTPQNIAFASPELISHLASILGIPHSFADIDSRFTMERPNPWNQAPGYPPLDDQPYVDSQIYREMRYAQQKAEASASFQRHAAFSGEFRPPDMMLPSIDPALGLTPSRDPELPASSLEAEAPSTSAASTALAPIEDKNLKIGSKWITMLNDPRLANHPIRKYAEDLNNIPRGNTRKYSRLKNQIELPVRLQHLKKGNLFDPKEKVLSMEDLRLLITYGPSVRSLFQRYFKRRDGYLLDEYRYLLDEVDSETGKFKLHTLHIHSLDPKMIPHYLARHFPELNQSAANRAGGRVSGNSMRGVNVKEEVDDEDEDIQENQEELGELEDPEDEE